MHVHVYHVCYTGTVHRHVQWFTPVSAVLQVMLGRVGVYLASLLGKKQVSVGGANAAGKKHGFRVTSSDIAQAYHLLHQLTMTCELSHARGDSVVILTLCTAPGVNGSHLKGMGLYLSISALNFAEISRPRKQLPGPIISEMYFTLGLQSSLSLPYLSSYAMVRHSQSYFFIWFKLCCLFL